MHVIGLGACLRLSIYAFDTLNEQMLGVVAAGMFLWMLIMTLGAAFDDWDKLSGREARRREEAEQHADE